MQNHWDHDVLISIINQSNIRTNGHSTTNSAQQHVRKPPVLTVC